MPMISIADALLKAFPSLEQLRAAKARATLKRWEEIVGGELGSQTHPEKFRDGTVIVHAQGSSWAQEIQMQKHKILKALNEAAGDELFHEIRFCGPRRKSQLSELNDDVQAEVKT